MIGLTLLCIAWVAIIIPIILAAISNTIGQFLLKYMRFLMSYLLAAFTIGELGVIILIFQFIERLLNLIF
jgi:hypothetical protein